MFENLKPEDIINITKKEFDELLEKERIYAASHGTMKVNELKQFEGYLSEKAKIVYQKHLKSTIIQDDSEGIRKCHLVQFMGKIARITLAAYLVNKNPEELTKRVLDDTAKDLAIWFNKGVENGWLDYGVLMPCFSIELSQLSPGRDYYVGVYVGSKYSMEELNKLYGKKIFWPEGELPSGT